MSYKFTKNGKHVATVFIWRQTRQPPNTMNAPAIVKREWRVQTADTVYEVVELQTVAIGKRTRKREVYCGYFSTFEAAKDYIRFTFADG